LQIEQELYRSILKPGGAGEKAFLAACEIGVVELQEAAHRTVEIIRTTPAFSSIDGQALSVILDIFSSYDDSYFEMLALVEPRDEPTTLSKLLSRLKISLSNEVSLSLASLMNSQETDTTDIPDTASVIILTSNTIRAIRLIGKFDLQFTNYTSAYLTTADDKLTPELVRARTVVDKLTGNSSSKRLTPGTTPPGSSTLIAALIKGLMLALDKKQKAYVSKATGTKMILLALQAKCMLFSINNLDYLIKHLPDFSNDDDVAESLVRNVEILHKQHSASINEFCSIGWKELLIKVAPIDESELQFKSGKITFESGRVLKARFDGFNTDFEALLSTFNSFTVTESSLRKLLRAQIIDVLIPKFSDFYLRYSVIKFSTKNQDEYIRYSPEIVRAKINELFE
jgi:hypothetical protein